MQEPSAPTKIEILIGQLEREVYRLSSLHQVELINIREANASYLQYLNEQFEKQLSVVNSAHQTKIIELENEIGYLKELNLAQRLMMEHNLGHIKGLEEKIAATRQQD